MASIFDISERLLGLQRLIDNTPAEELDEQTIVDTLDGIEGEMVDKLTEYAAVIRNAEADIEPMKQAEKQIAARRKALENKVERMKIAAEMGFKLTDRKKIDDPRFQIGYRKKPPFLQVEDEDKIPETYWTPQDPKLDRKLALDMLKAGKKVPGCRIVDDGESFFIK